MYLTRNVKSGNSTCLRQSVLTESGYSAIRLNRNGLLHYHTSANELFALINECQ